MALGNQTRWSARGQSMSRNAAIDEGLRAFMLRVYNYMASALALTGIVAYALAQMSVTFGPEGAILSLTGLGEALFNSPLRWLVILAPFAFILVLSFGIERMRASTAQTVFWLFAAVMGASMASLFIVYTGASIARVFFITAGTFGAMSLYGYTTKTDLSRFGSFLFMGLIGVIIASLVNLFLGSSVLQFAISVIGVLVFIGLTAYDTQMIKNSYHEGDDSETAGKKAIHGALRIYLDFVNMFILLLQLFGSRR